MSPEMDAAVFVFQDFILLLPPPSLQDTLLFFLSAAVDLMSLKKEEGTVHPGL